MKIYCHNVRVWTRDRDKSSEWYWKARMSRISDLIAAEQYDILCLQELSFPANLRLPGGYRRLCPSISHPIYVRKGIKTRRHRFHTRWDECEVKVGEEWMLLINVHLHWKESIFTRSIEAIRDRIDTAIAEGQGFVACGDWNVGRDILEDEFNYKAYVFPWDSYTFKNSNTGKEGKIDFFVANYADIWENDIYIGDAVLSDHRPIRLISSSFPL